ncbi:MAG: hypothetical protein CMM79_03400 [Rhodospirillaceae bacterium]|nr:hypothetical protein [Rhodospirillaceae bacterium]
MLAHDDDAAIATARPDGIITCGLDEPDVMGTAMGSVRMVAADALATSDDKLGLLASLLPEGGSA